MPSQRSESNHPRNGDGRGEHSVLDVAAEKVRETEVNPSPFAPRRHSIRFLALLLLGLALCRTGRAEPLPPLAEGFRMTTRQASYDLQGNSIQALLAEKNEKGPLDNGKRFFAHTHWELHWNYRYEQKGGSFVITTLSVTADIHYTMPRRIPPTGEPDRVAQPWARFIGALNTHEQGHAENGAQHGKALYALLRKPRVFASAQELKDFVATEGAKCLAEAKAADVEYDERTEHGEKQGATLR